MSTILLFIVVLGVLVFVHELGHFLVAKWSGMKVEEFGFGFPPKLFGIRRGETEYTLNWIPFGGFVRITGEDHSADAPQLSEADKQRTFRSKPFWKQALVLLAGVFMNLVLAFVLLSIVFMMGATVPQDHVRPGDHVERTYVQIAQVLPGSLAEDVEIQLGDELVAIDQQAVTSAQQASALVEPMKERIQTEGAATFSLDIQRGDERMTIQLDDITQLGEQDSVLGVGFLDVADIRLGPLSAMREGFVQTGYMTGAVAWAFVTLVRDLVSGAGVSGDVSGPIGIAQAAGQAADRGVSDVLQLVAILSINLAVLNVLPLPALDGGRFTVAVIERIRKKELPQKAIAWVHASGLIFFIVIMLAVSVRDIVRWIQ